MAESVVSPTPVFMGEINQGFPRYTPTASDVPVLASISAHSAWADLRADLRELRANQGSAAASFASFQVSQAEKFAKVREDQLSEKIADLKSKSDESLLSQILAKLVTTPTP